MTSTVLLFAAVSQLALSGTVTAAESVSSPRNRPSPTNSSEKVRVLLVRFSNRSADATWPALLERIEKELSLSNLKISIVDAVPTPDTSPRRTLDTILKDSAAQGALSITVSFEVAVELHTLFLNRDTGLPEYRRYFLVSKPTDDAAEVAAIKTREAVLAALYERNLESNVDNIPSKNVDRESSRSTTATTSPPERSRRGKTTDRKTIRLAATFGGAWSPGGVGIMGTAGGDISIRLLNRFLLGAGSWASVPTREIKTSLGEASVRLIAGRLNAAFLLQPLGPMQPVAGIRLGILSFNTEGKSDTHPVASVSKVLFYGSIFAETSFTISERIFLPISLDVGALIPGVDILFAGETKASLTPFMLEAKIGIGILL